MEILKFLNKLGITIGMIYSVVTHTPPNNFILFSMLILIYFEVQKK